MVAQAKNAAAQIQTSFDAIHGRTVPLNVDLNLPSGITLNQSGGKTQRHAAGGLITGGTPGRDSVLAALMPGEVVVPTNMVRSGAVDHLRGRLPGFGGGGMVDRLRGALPGFAAGGIVGPTYNRNVSYGSFLPPGVSIAFNGGPAPVAVYPGGGGHRTYNLEVTVGQDYSKAELGRKTVEALKEFEKRSGTSWRR
jgi:hypothetical protein